MFGTIKSRSNRELTPAVYPASARRRKIMMNSIYIVIVNDDEEEFQYEYGLLSHAREQYNDEQHAQLIEYDGNEHFLMECK